MGWTKEETDYLLDMLEAYDLRFVVVADRYNVSLLTIQAVKCLEGQLCVFVMCVCYVISAVAQCLEICRIAGGM
jgi:hypothetical protein